MTAPELFFTPREVAEMFRVSTAALNSQRKRGLEPGSLAVKVGGKHLYPRALVEDYLGRLASSAQANLGLDDALASELFRAAPTSSRVLTLAEASQRLGIERDLLVEQWENVVYPGALGWRSTPDSEIVFAPRDINIWIQANADESRKDTSSARAQ